MEAVVHTGWVRLRFLSTKNSLSFCDKFLVLAISDACSFVCVDLSISLIGQLPGLGSIIKFVRLDQSLEVAPGEQEVANLVAEEGAATD